MGMMGSIMGQMGISGGSNQGKTSSSTPKKSGGKVGKGARSDKGAGKESAPKGARPTPPKSNAPVGQKPGKPQPGKKKPQEVNYG